jgi:hypothetical protein
MGRGISPAEKYCASAFNQRATDDDRADRFAEADFRPGSPRGRGAKSRHPTEAPGG